MAIHSSILTWKSPWTEEPGRLQSMGPQESDTTWWLNHDHHISAVTAAKWIPFRLFQRCWLSQYSCPHCPRVRHLQIPKAGLRTWAHSDVGNRRGPGTNPQGSQGATGLLEAQDITPITGIRMTFSLLPTPMSCRQDFLSRALVTFGAKSLITGEKGAVPCTDGGSALGSSTRCQTHPHHPSYDSEECHRNLLDFLGDPVASLEAQTVKNLPAMQEAWVRSLGQEDPLEKEMAFHSSVLAWRTPWTEEPGGPQSVGSHRVWSDWAQTH